MRFIKSVLSILQRPSSRYSIGALLALGALVSVVALGGTAAFFSSTNSLEFCVSCHEMSGVVYEDYKESMHYKNSSGVRAECPDCHVPKGTFAMLKAKVIAVKDIWHHLWGTVGTPEKFEAARWRMANRVWAFMKETDSATCRSCHNFNFMDLSEQPRLARRKHERAQDEGKTCIECHAGVVHSQPDEPEELEEPLKES